MQDRQLGELVQGGNGTAYYPENPPLRGTLKKLLLPDVQTLFICKLGKQDSHDSQFLVMWSKMPRSMSQRDRQWAAAIGAKLRKCFA